MKPEDLIDDPTRQQLCKSCSKCCTMLGIYTAYPWPNEPVADFYRARGFEVREKQGRVFLSQHNPCPHLKKSGACDIYDNRPQPCREYSCLEDLDVLGDTAWSKHLDERLIKQ